MKGFGAAVHVRMTFIEIEPPSRSEMDGTEGMTQLLSSEPCVSRYKNARLPLGRYIS